MSEIREDPFTGRRVIIAKERANRPIDNHGLNNEREVIETDYNGKCPFCYGNEHMTPKEVDSIRKGMKWKVRVVHNRFPILSSNDQSNEKEDFYVSYDGYGYHEVVIETYKHNGSFFNMTENEFYDYLVILKRRYIDLKNRDNVKFISLFKNYQKNAGASLEHPHSQILTTPFIPDYIEKEINNSKKYFNDKGENLHNFIISYEKEKKERVIHESEHFIVIAPYASFYNNEVEIIYKENKRFEDIYELEINELSIIIKKLFEKMHSILGKFPFNMFIHTHPIDEAVVEIYKWHIHITPRLAYQAGFELSTGVFVNAVVPENAAKLFRW